MDDKIIKFEMYNGIKKKKYAHAMGNFTMERTAGFSNLTRDLCFPTNHKEIKVSEI